MNINYNIKTNYGPYASLVKITTIDYLITDVDGYSTICVDTSAGNITITLPTVSTNTGRSLTIKKTTTDSYYVKIVGTIDGITNDYLFDMGESLTVQSSVQCGGQLILFTTKNQE